MAAAGKRREPRREVDLLEAPKGLPRGRRPRTRRDTFGRFSESFARGMGTSGFLIGLTVLVIVWLIWNSALPRSVQFDPRAGNFTLLTLLLSLQASYAAPLILLAQNRQDDRDRVQVEQDRQRAERNLDDTEYLAREIVDLRLLVRDVASKDFVRQELRSLLEELDRRDADRTMREQEARGAGTPQEQDEDLDDRPGAGRTAVSAVADLVRAAVGAVQDPEIRRPLADLDMLDAVVVDGRAALIDVSLTVVGCPASDRIEREVRVAALSVPGVDSAEVRLGVMAPARRQALADRLRGARRNPFAGDSLTRVLAVTSGKGGVGKSTVTANLAVALAARGLSVGVLDADVHGFSIPGLLGIAPDVEPVNLDGLIVPPVAHGVKAVSIGMFLPRDQRDGAVAWRGPMLHRTLQQFLTDVHFGDLDVLLVDTPPGTGDVAISLGQLLPGAEVLVVTTPQPAASDVAVRSGLVARQLGQRVVGVVETMAPAPMADGTLLDLFGSGGGAEVARRLSDGDDQVPLLASVPLSGALRRAGDAGTPVVLAQADDAAAQALDALAGALAARGRGLAGRPLPLGV